MAVNRTNHEYSSKMQCNGSLRQQMATRAKWSRKIQELRKVWLKELRSSLNEPQCYLQYAATGGFYYPRRKEWVFLQERVWHWLRTRSCHICEKMKPYCNFGTAHASHWTLLLAGNWTPWVIDDWDAKWLPGPIQIRPTLSAAIDSSLCLTETAWLHRKLKKVH